MSERDGYQRWQKLVHAGTVPPVLALGGPERALVDDALAWVHQQALPTQARDFNWNQLDGAQCTLSQVVAAARVFPVLAFAASADGLCSSSEDSEAKPGSGRLDVLSSSEDSEAKPRSGRLVELRGAGELKADGLPALQDYLAHPCEKTHLVMVFGATVGKNPLWGALQKAGCAFAFAHPQPWHMSRWVRTRAQRLGLAVTEAGAAALAETVGPDLLLVDRALERLALECESVTPDDVARCVAQVPLDDVFALSQAVAQGHVARALACLSRLPQGPDVPLRLLGVWAWQLRQIVAVRVLLEQGKDAQAVGKHLRLSGPRLQASISLARQGTLAGHCARLCHLRTLDEALKTSCVPAWLQMQRAILALCPSTRDPRQRA